MQSESGREGFISVASANWASSWFWLNIYCDCLLAAGCWQNFNKWLSLILNILKQNIVIPTTNW